MYTSFKICFLKYNQLDKRNVTVQPDFNLCHFLTGVLFLSNFLFNSNISDFKLFFLIYNLPDTQNETIPFFLDLITDEMSAYKHLSGLHIFALDTEWQTRAK